MIDPKAPSPVALDIGAKARQTFTDEPTPARPLLGYAPGDYDSLCCHCGQVFSNADKRAVTCFPCAFKQYAQSATLADDVKAGRQPNPEVVRLVEEFSKRWAGAEAEKESAMTEEPSPRPTLDTTPTAPKVGQRVRIGDKVGVVCEPNDPGRSGTYTSKKYGEIPVKMLGNRAARRKAAAQKGKSR